MKNLFTIAFILAAFAVKSQVYISPEIGWSTTKSLQLSIQTGYEYKRMMIEFDLRTHIDRRSPALMGVRLGYAIQLGSWSISPLAATYYKLVSTDKKQLNGFVMGAGLRLRAGNGATLQCSYAGKIFFIGIGFKN